MRTLRASRRKAMSLRIVPMPRLRAHGRPHVRVQENEASAQLSSGRLRRCAMHTNLAWLSRTLRSRAGRGHACSARAHGNECCCQRHSSSQASSGAHGIGGAPRPLFIPQQRAPEMRPQGMSSKNDKLRHQHGWSAGGSVSVMQHQGRPIRAKGGPTMCMLRRSQMPRVVAYGRVLL